MTRFTLNTKGKHHADGNRSILFGEFGSPRNQLGIKVGGDVLVDNLAFTHFGITMAG